MKIHSLNKDRNESIFKKLDNVCLFHTCVLAALSDTSPAVKTRSLVHAQNGKWSLTPFAHKNTFSGFFGAIFQASCLQH